MNLEPVTQSEVRQKEKNKYIMCLYGTLKSAIDEPICREGMKTQLLENGLVDAGGGRESVG